MSTLGSCLCLYDMNIAGEVPGPGYNKLVKEPLMIKCQECLTRMQAQSSLGIRQP